MEDIVTNQVDTQSLLVPSSSIHEGDDDSMEIGGARDFAVKFVAESKKLWSLAFPVIFATICVYGISAVTQVFAGHVSTLALAALSMEASAVSGIPVGILAGMGSAVGTICGQAYGAGELEMMGIYMQRFWVILNATALLMCLPYVFAGPLLRLIGQTPEISKVTGVFCIWMIPQLFAYAMNFPIGRFLQSQSKIVAMAAIYGVALALHSFFCWLLMLKLRWGLAGAAVMLDWSWWFMFLGQLGYVLSGGCGRTWSGFSWKAFHNLWESLKLSLASALMSCLDTWYPTIPVLLAGYLKNSQVSVDAISICINIMGLSSALSTGIGIAMSVRISNELGAGNRRRIKLSFVVAIITSTLISLIVVLVLIAFHNKYPILFSNDTDVQTLVKQLTPILTTYIVVNNVQVVLSGVAIGACWQYQVAFVNFVCFYLIGVPLELLIGFKLDMGVKGIFLAMLLGTTLQASCILLWIFFGTDWKTEVHKAEDRLRKWRRKF